MLSFPGVINNLIFPPNMYYFLQTSIYSLCANDVQHIYFQGKKNFIPILMNLFLVRAVAAILDSNLDIRPFPNSERFGNSMRLRILILAIYSKDISSVAHIVIVHQYLGIYHVQWCDCCAMHCMST